MYKVKLYNFFKTRQKHVHATLLIFLFVLVILSGGYIHINDFLLMAIYSVIPLTILLLYSNNIQECKIKYRDEMLFTVVIYTIIYIIVFFGSGFVFGYGKSPYNTTFLGIVHNIFIYGLPIISIEVCRYYLVNIVKRKKYKILHYIGITLLCIFCKLNLSVILNISSLKILVEYISQILLPCICRNILATYLASILGIVPVCVYMFVVEFVEFIPPILPDLQWLTQGVINISLPLFAYIGISFKYNRISKKFKEYKSTKENIFSWVITCTVSVIVIWFSIGVFSYFPSVIVTGSMIPVINPGDVVIIEKVQDKADIDKLKIGDVIQFRRDNILIVHRITNLVLNKVDGLIYYQTKGDNNSAIDLELVNPNDVKGTLYKVIPKIGWPTLILRHNESINVEDVEF